MVGAELRSRLADAFGLGGIRDFAESLDGVRAGGFVLAVSLGQRIQDFLESARRRMSSSRRVKYWHPCRG